MSHYKDLREVYAKEMEFHGFGYGLYNPIAADDIHPPCCGFFDRNGDWNLIARLDVGYGGQVLDTQHRGCYYGPLDHMPEKSTTIGPAWQPKTSLGTESMMTNTTVDTPDQLPGGANAQLRFQTKSKFGAVLMACKPITLVAYNAERLFLNWLRRNRPQLYQLHGEQLRDYGLWVVTRTYSAPGASINAWLSSKHTVNVSGKAKASMLGELGQGLSLTDTDQDSDWSHYRAKTDKGIALFIDGLFMGPWEWKFEGIKLSIPGLNNVGEGTSYDRNPPDAKMVARRASSMHAGPHEMSPIDENQEAEARRRKNHEPSDVHHTVQDPAHKEGRTTPSRYPRIPTPPLRHHNDNSNLRIPLRSRSRSRSSHCATWFSAHDPTEWDQQEQEQQEQPNHDVPQNSQPPQDGRPSHDSAGRARLSSGETRVNSMLQEGTRSGRNFSSPTPPLIDVQTVDASVLKDVGLGHTLSRSHSLHSQPRHDSISRSPLSSRVPSLRHESRRVSMSP